MEYSRQNPDNICCYDSNVCWTFHNPRTGPVWADKTMFNCRNWIFVHFNIDNIASTLVFAFWTLIYIFSINNFADAPLTKGNLETVQFQGGPQKRADSYFPREQRLLLVRLVFNWVLSGERSCESIVEYSGNKF